jgi:hypothetical protein
MVAGFRSEIQAQDFTKYKEGVLTTTLRGWISFRYGAAENFPSTLLKCRVCENLSPNIDS